MARLSYLSLLELIGCFVDAKTYIVQLSKPLHGSPAAHLSLRARGLEPGDPVSQSEFVSLPIEHSTIVYNYTSAITGFAAKLSDSEAHSLKGHPGVLSVTEDRMIKLHTTRSPQFLGLTSNWGLFGRDSPLDNVATMESHRRNPSTESDIIIGVLDTGAWPEAPGYSDSGLGAIPSHWKGECVTGEKWTASNCNKKLIGARYFYKGFMEATNQTEETFNLTKSARDDDGHGTHTSTTAAGAEVANANLFGQASGTARGMAPAARIAMYKVCWEDGCALSDIGAGLDYAIEDGVNIISMSLGGDPSTLDARDLIVTSAFKARRKGIAVVQSAGNSGPAPYTTEGTPWILTVGASSIDRDFPAVLVIDGGKNYTGTSIPRDSKEDPKWKPLPQGKDLPLFWAGDAPATGNVTASSLCLNGTLDASKVAGKIVVCQRGESGRVEKGFVVRDLGAVGMVLVNAQTDGDSLVSDPHALPAVHVSYTAGLQVVAAAKAGNKKATIDLEGTVYGTPAPVMAAFSSRFPNVADPGILKPDITAPGVSILADWTQAVSISDESADVVKLPYNIISGTSMSCPHVSGLTAFIMSRRPDWSVAEINSALMTTAYSTTKGTSKPLGDGAGGSATPGAYGNGHVDPVRALDPGLVYNISDDEWINYACGYNASDDFVSALTGTETHCDLTKAISSFDLNYPSFSGYYNTSVTARSPQVNKFHRKLTNVAGAGTYTAKVTLMDQGDSSLVHIDVNPTTLTFSGAGDKQKFTVTATLQPNTTAADIMSFGRLVWSDGQHEVASSLAFLWTEL